MILLTGSTGFVGQQLIGKLAKLDKVRCLVRDEKKSDELKAKGYETVIWDIEKDVQVAEAAKNVSVVVHAAAELRGNKQKYMEVNVRGTKNLVEVCKKSGVKQIIYLSSILADSAYNNDYGNSKRAGEEIVKASGINYTILRIGNLYSDKNAKTFSKLLKLIRTLPVLPVFGQVNTQFVRLDDVTDAIASAVGNPNAVNRTYYLVGEKMYFEKFFRLAAKKLGKKRLVIRFPLALAKAAFAVYKPIGRLIRLPVHPDTLIIDREFDTASAEKELKFHKSSEQDLLQSI